MILENTVFIPHVDGVPIGYYINATMANIRSSQNEPGIGFVHNRPPGMGVFTAKYSGACPDLIDNEIIDLNMKVQIVQHLSRRSGKEGTLFYCVLLKREKGFFCLAIFSTFSLGVSQHISILSGS